MLEKTLKLRPINLGDEVDIRFMYDTRFHLKVCQHLMNSTPPGASFPPSLDSHRQWLKANVPQRRLMFLMWAEEQRVGYCHAYDFVGKDTVEVGFVVHPDHQGKGYGKEAVLLLLEHLTTRMPEKKIILYVRKENVRAIGIYRKLGFTEAGIDEYSYRFDWEN